MTRKDYELFAKLLAELHVDFGEKIPFKTLLHNIEEVFKRDNPRFNFDKFEEKIEEIEEEEIKQSITRVRGRLYRR